MAPIGSSIDSGVRTATHAASPFLSTVRPSRHEQRLASAIVLASILVFLGAAPFAQVPLTPITAFLPAYQAAVIIGDIITFQLRSGEPAVATHRVVQRIVTDDGAVSFVTKGDANDAADPTPVLPIQVRGKVWYAIPYLGWVNTWLGGSTRAIAVPLVAGLLFAYATWMLVAGLRERRAVRSSRE